MKQEDINKIRKAVEDLGIIFVFFPSEDLIKMIINQPNHPNIKDIPRSMISELLSRNGVVLDNQMVYSYVSKKLNKKNSWILDRGEIRFYEDKNDPNKEKYKVYKSGKDIHYEIENKLESKKQEMQEFLSDAEKINSEHK